MNGEGDHDDWQRKDHDLLLRIDERIQKFDRCLTIHLAHHWAFTLAAGGAILTALISLVIALGTK